MGAGKTTFIRSICSELGVKENVTSPTFSIVNEYRDSYGKPVYHFDFYRIEKEQEAVDIGCEEYFYSGALCLIEWPEKILNLLPHELVKITIEVTHTKRRFTFSYE
jgi:tRNA threonylcarbamoyladenosine biosynthesis protein TsaE